MASKKKNSSKAKSPEPAKSKIPQKPQPPKGLKLNLGVKLKEEIFGLMMMLVCVLMILSIVTHVPREQPSTIMELWRANQLSNLLGIVGAYLSHYLVSYTFGYAFLAVPILFLVYGWLFFTHKSIFLVNKFAFYILTLMVIVAGWIAIPTTFSQSASIAADWGASGLLGGLIANQMFISLGKFGTAAIWTVVSLIWIIVATRVSIADLIPAVRNIFLSTYTRTTETISKFKSRQDELLTQNQAADTGAIQVTDENPLIPTYLQQGRVDNEQIGEKTVKTTNGVVKTSEHTKEPVEGEGSGKKTEKSSSLTDDLAYDTQLVNDLKAIGHIDKRFSINSSRLMELEAVGSHDADQDLKTPPADMREKTVEPVQPDKTIEELEVPSEPALDMSNMDFKDIAKGLFDAEHGHINIEEETKEIERAKTRLSVRPQKRQKTQETIVQNENPDDLKNSDETGVDVPESKPYDAPAEVVVAANQSDKPAQKLEKVKSPPAKDESIDYDHENQQARKRYKHPSIDLLEPTQAMEKLTPEEISDLDNKISQIITKLGEFGIETKVVATEYGGPVVAIYQLELPSGLKISRITGLEDELALALKVKSVRMIPVTSKGTIQVEIPKPKASPVLIRALFEDPSFRNAKQKYKLGLALGKTIDGHIHFEDLAKMPHLLIAGTTGSGKSVGINSIITSILYQFDPSEVKFIMVDPKKVELALYRRLKNHHLIALRNQRDEIIEDVITRPENAKLMLKALVDEMEKRYEKLAEAGVRNIEDYNKRWHDGRMPDSGKYNHYKLEYIIAIIDELADLMMTAPREVETSITRLAQMARAVGIHLIVATQRPSVDVLTGLIKANFPARIAYAVRSKIDSRTILDMGGAEQLLGKGDMLFMPPGQNPIRIQNAFTSTLETETIVDFINRMPAFPRRDFVVKEEAKEGAEGDDVDTSGFDELFNQAVEIVVKHNQGSASLLQRRLAVGYARAARLIDQLEKAGIVSAPDGAKPRQVLITEDQMPMYLT